MKRVLSAVLAIVGAAAFSQSLKIYTEDFPPLQILAPDGKLSGIAIDTVREIQKRVGNSDTIQIVPWARSYQEIQANANVVLFAMSRTGDRDKLFQWVGPIDETVFHFYIKADSKIVMTTLDDAKKLGSIGVYRNDVRDIFLTNAGFTNLDRGTENVINVKKLMLGRIDAFAANTGEIGDLVRAAGYTLSDLKESLMFLKTQQFIAFSKGTPESVVKAWQDALDAMKKDRTFQVIFRKYEPDKPLPGPAKTSF